MRQLYSILRNKMYHKFLWVIHNIAAHDAFVIYELNVSLCIILKTVNLNERICSSMPFIEKKIYIIYDYRNWIKIILQRNLQTIISCYQLWVFYIMTIDKNWDTFICEGHLWPVEYKKMYAIYINYFIYCSIKE